MAFCVNCGYNIDDGAKFCPNCGYSVAVNKSIHNGRKTVYEGDIYKCPNCGEVLPSFAANCPSCGYEIRGNSAVKSIQEFYLEINRATTNSQVDSMIRNFPIPNSKEDILEFMVIASSNILGEDDKDIYEAWLAKFEQAYQKAVLLFKTEDDFSKIRKIYENCQNNINAEKQRKINKLTIDTVIRNIAVGVGMVLIIVSISIDHTGGNCSLVELAGCIILIVSAFSLFKRGAMFIDYAVSVVSGLLMIPLSFLLYNGSMTELCGVIVLIIAVVNYFKSLKRTGREGK